MTAPIIAGIDPGRPEEAPLAFAAELARVVGAPLWVVAVVIADGLGAVPVRELARSRFAAAAEAVDARMRRRSRRRTAMLQGFSPC